MKKVLFLSPMCFYFHSKIIKLFINVVPYFIVLIIMFIIINIIGIEKHLFILDVMIKLFT